MLISGSGVIKLSDFGLTTLLEHPHPRGKHTSDAPWYRAPEVDEGKSCLKSDVWSLGMSASAMAYGLSVFEDGSPEEVMDEVCSIEYPPEPSFEALQQLTDFLKRCLVEDVNERASVEELLRVSVSSESED